LERKLTPKEPQFIARFLPSLWKPSTRFLRVLISFGVDCRSLRVQWGIGSGVWSGFSFWPACQMATPIASTIRFRWNSCLRACRLSAFQFSWVIKACASPRSITRRGFGHGRNNWRPTFGALGMLTNRNKGYTPGTRRTTRA